MASTDAIARLGTNDRAKADVSVARLYVLRATYLLLVVGLGAVNLPVLISHDPTSRGVIPSVLGGIWLLAVIGLRYPLQMLPLLLFEFSWKTIWLLVYGLPQWSAGQMPPTWTEDVKAIRRGRDPDADGHPVGLRLPSIHQPDVRVLALSRSDFVPKARMLAGILRVRSLGQ